MKYRQAIKRLKQFLCLKMIGHKPNTYEWGYGGHGKVDVWCKYCDKMFQIPIEEARFRYPIFNEIRPDKSMKR